MVTPLRPEGDDAPASRQAELAREAGERGASAVIAVPDDPQLLSPALQALREQGIAVVVLGEEVPVEGKPFPRVSAPPLDRIAEEVVAKSQEVARAQGLDEKGPATIIAPEPLGDGRIVPRVEAFRRALERAGIPVGTIITFRAGPEDASKKLEASRSDSKPSSFVIAVEDFGLLDAANVRQDRMGRDNFVIAGFADQRDANPYLNSGALNVVVVGSYREQAKKALELAVSLVEGQAPPTATVEVDTPIRVSMLKPVQRVYTYGMHGLEPESPLPPTGGPTRDPANAPAK